MNFLKRLAVPDELFFEESLNIIQENSTQYDEPLISFTDSIIQHGIQANASDIHIEPYEKSCRIRYRHDGILHEIAEIPTPLATRLVIRLKVMAKLDITEKRLPQDGRIQKNNVDIRINTCPTLYGEKIVLRLLNLEKVSLDLNDLGLLDQQLKLFLNKISQPQGLILVTGPTGSGKTLTLYSALNHLNSPEKNILTIEDPIEIQMNGINQANIHPKIGLDFSHTLRTFLRQDPDIIMVGEIRDQETAGVAMQASQTGHLVLSSLHTNNAIETLIRLQAMGIASYNIIHSISLIIAQRLVRKLCPHCKKPDTSSPSLPFLIYKADKCKSCINGYSGRTGIFELLPISETLSQLLLSNANNATLLTQAKNEGFLSLSAAGLEKINLGITSFAELNRVISL